MLSAAVTFFIIAILAAFLGFGGIASTAASIAQILFIIFLSLFLLSLILGALRGGWNMFYVAGTLFLIAVGAGVLGYTGIAAQFAVLAKFLFVLFFLLFLVSIVLSFFKRTTEDAQIKS